MATSRDKIKDKGRIINCFAYREDQCAVLKEIYCIKENYDCPFYKTKKEYRLLKAKEEVQYEDD